MVALSLACLMAVPTGPFVGVIALLDALDAAKVPEAIQDAVATAAGDAGEIPLSAVKGLLTRAGIGMAAATRIVGRLVSGFARG
jgi:hypothetical protein